MADISPPPLTGIRVLELAGLAPGPYAGMLMADYGASVLRIDRTHPAAHSDKLPPRSRDQLTRRKASLAIDIKSSRGRSLLLSLVAKADILIDPFRPGVLESLSLGPATLLAHNPRLILARMTGFRRTGPYAQQAGHDINYLAVGGVLSLLGRSGAPPYPPANLLGDFGGGGLVLFVGVLLALLHRERTGKGQVVEANMVDGAAHIATFARLALTTPSWNQPRGENVLDGGNPFYDSYATKDGKYMAVGALEPQFFAELVNGLGLDQSWRLRRVDKKTWPKLRKEMEAKFKSKTRKEWEEVFAGSDACCTPVLEHAELWEAGHDQRPIVTLRDAPSLAVQSKVQGRDSLQGQQERDPSEGQGCGVDGDGWTSQGLAPGEGGEAILKSWTGWQRGRQYEVVNGGLVVVEDADKAKL